MTSLSRFTAFSAAVCLVTFAGCGPTVDPELTLTPSPRTINGRGESTTITVTATDEEGKPGTGTVTFKINMGEVDEPRTVLDATGTAVIHATCSRATDPACTGTMKVDGSWTTKKGKTATATANVSIGLPVDAGTDAGVVDAGIDAGIVDAGVDAGLPSDAGLTIVASRSNFFIGAQDVVTLSAQLTGVTPAAGQPLQFSTNTGLLRSAPDAGSSTVITVNTDSTGTATAELVDGAGQMAQLATITVSHAPTGKTANTTVDMLTLRQVSHVETRCGATLNCALMGVRGSGYQETAQVTFVVTDALGRPAVGARVNFSLNTPPAGVMLDRLSEITDAMGHVTAAVQSGAALGVFSVQAVVVPGQVEGSSPALAIRGAKPANKQFRLFCATVNIPAYKSATPPLGLTVMCTVRVVDRNNNPVGTGLSVSLKTEAGNVGNSVATAAFANNNANEGLGTFSFDTTGGVWPPVDTVPFGPLPSQFPGPRLAEPQRTVGPVTRNPRDGLITIMAYVVGEESFDDNNGNGVYDLGEPFVDQSEPFVDSNDNNVWDPGEIIVPELVNGVDNGVWDPPNGVYDRNKLIWTETKILATDAAAAGIGTIEGTNPGLCPAGVPKGGFTDFAVYLPDLNLNRVQAGSSLGLSRLGTRGSVGWATGTSLLDGYGFEFERVLVNAADPTLPCVAGSTGPPVILPTPRCVWQSSFGRWDRGYVGTARVTGMMASDISPCANEPGLTADVNVLSTDVQTAPITFGVQ